jgi:hypothetical protein
MMLPIGFGVNFIFSHDPILNFLRDVVYLWSHSEVNMNDLNRVLLRDLRGRPKKYLTFEEVQAPPKARGKNHHVIVIDRSGSMCGDIGPMREMLCKLFAAAPPMPHTPQTDPT